MGNKCGCSRAQPPTIFYMDYNNCVYKMGEAKSIEENGKVYHSNDEGRDDSF